jgi:transcriptional regulator with XRE-family HTH domain
MGRHPTNFWRPGIPRNPSRYHSEWSIVVGDRVRRLRMARDWRLIDLAWRVPKPEGGCYSAGYFSRLERGWGNPPLCTYVRTAEAFDVHPGVLLGPDEVQREITPAQEVLLRVLDRAGIEPDEAIARLALGGREAADAVAQLPPGRSGPGVDPDGVEVHGAAAEGADHEHVAAGEEAA